MRLTAACILPAAGILSLLLACGGGGEPAGWLGTVVDSAGVVVVVSEGDGPADSEWTLELEELFGGMEGPIEHQFAHIASVTPTAGGNVLVTDQGASAVRVYGRDGQLVAELGTAGSGPGEFSPNAGPALVGRGDTILVPDMGNQRVSVFSSQGDFLSSLPLDVADGFPMGWLGAEDGRVMGLFRDLSTPGARDMISEWGATAGRSPELVRVDRGESYDFSGGTPTMRLFAREPGWALIPGGGFITAVNDAVELEVRDASGVLRRIVRRANDPKPVTEAHTRLFQDGIRKAWIAAGMDPATAGGMSETIEVAETYPAFMRLLVGPEGSIWVQRARAADELTDSQREAFDFTIHMGSEEWLVFDAEGRYAGTEVFPVQFQVFSYGLGQFWGVVRDEFDVQRVAVVHARRPG